MLSWLLVRSSPLRLLAVHLSSVRRAKRTEYDFDNLPERPEDDDSNPAVKKINDQIRFAIWKEGQKNLTGEQKKQLYLYVKRKENEIRQLLGLKLVGVKLRPHKRPPHPKSAESKLPPPQPTYLYTDEYFDKLREADEAAGISIETEPEPTTPSDLTKPSQSPIKIQQLNNQLDNQAPQPTKRVLRSTSSLNLKVAVIGQTVASLTFGLALARAGFTPDFVLARSGFESPAVLLQPPAVWILDQLGVGDKLRAAASQLHKYQLSNDSNRTDSVVFFEELQRSWKDLPFLSVSSEDLRQILREAIIATDKSITFHHQRLNSLRSITTNQYALGFGSRLDKFDVIVAADGPDSRSARHLFGEFTRRPKPIEIYHGIVPMPSSALQSAIIEEWKRPEKLRLVPVGAHRVWITYTRPSPRRIDSIVEGERQAGAFLGDISARFKSPLVNQLIEAFRMWESKCSMELTYELPYNDWIKHNVVLLGSAAFGVPHWTGQRETLEIRMASQLAQTIIKHRSNFDVKLMQETIGSIKSEVIQTTEAINKLQDDVIAANLPETGLRRSFALWRSGFKHATTPLFNLIRKQLGQPPTDQESQ